MADQPEQHEKTEDPTQKRLNEAIEKGDVPKSQEVTSWFVLLSGALLVGLFSTGVARDLAYPLKVLLEQAHAISPSGNDFGQIMNEIVLATAGALGLPVILMIVVAVSGNLVQHRLILTGEPLKPKLEKVSPLAGLKRLFSPQSLVNFAKSMAKFAIVSAVIFLVIWPKRDQLDTLVFIDPALQLPFTRTLAIQVFIAVLSVLAIVAALDFAYQRHTWWQKQRMTLKEVKDEMKQTDGDPHVKARIRQIRVERARKRMMAAVPEATVVITNPTHFAVALKYENGMAAPVCVAKGVDTVALRIRALAEDNEVPVVENPPLARALHAGVELDEQVPPDHYKAVAQVIGYVMQLKQRQGWRTAH